MTDRPSIQMLFEQLMPHPQVRQAGIELLKDYILTAHGISPLSWVVYLYRSKLVFLIRNIYTLSYGIDLKGRNVESLIAFVSEEALNEPDRVELMRLGCSVSKGFDTAPHGVQVQIPLADPEKFLEAVEIVRRKFPDYLHKTLKPGMETAFKNNYLPEVVDYLRTLFGPDIPHPEYYSLASSVSSDNPSHGNGVTMDSIIAQMQNSLRSNGYSFTNEQIAAFYTALQTKGFVILATVCLMKSYLS